MTAWNYPRRTLLLALAFQLLAALSVFSQEEKDWTLVGSWVNKAYETSRTFLAKVVYGDDGMMSLYQRLSDRTRLRWPYTVEKDWTEPGFRWFKIKYSDGHLNFCEIIRLSQDGNTLDAVGAFGDFPAEFDMNSKSYYHYTRHRE